MDHLPYPNLDVPPIVVPYLHDYEYDGGKFATFPERAGFYRDGMLDLNRPCRQLAALAQAWLFFGLIDVFTGQHVDKGVLIRMEDNNRTDGGVVDTTKLGGILAECFRFPRMMPLRSSEVLEGMRARLMEAAQASSTLDQVQADDSLSSAVFLSIKILIICLSEMFDAHNTSRLYSKISNIPSQNSFRDPMVGTGRSNGKVPGPARLLMDRMSQSGWCIHQILDICHTHNYCTVYYYSSIARAESWNEITHKTCTETQCVAYNIKDDSAYKIRHTEECSGCELIGPPEDEVANVVRNGDIPLVELNSASLENQTQLAVKPSTAHSRYTAISHVWIDDHGNPTANILPRCQLQRLAARLSAISNAQQSWIGRLWKRQQDSPSISHLLWMDTLCIPSKEDLEDQKSLRKKAIHRMALIYAAAEQVLVLDAELDKITYEGNPLELTDALISCSRWNSRCWTLEEGALARKCLFQFKDVAAAATHFHQSILLGSIRKAIPFTIDDARSWCSPYAWPPPKISPDFAHEYLCFKLAEAAQRSTQTDIGHASHAILRRKPDRDLQTIKFMRTWNDIGRRSTTRPEDIHPIMANLTDFSAAQIMGLETPVLRTKMITHCIGEFPLDLLWTPCTRPRANEDSADRWIPSIPGPEPLKQRVKLRSTGMGLVVDTGHSWKPPITFRIPLGMVAPRFCFRWWQLWCVVECIIAKDDMLPRNASETACLIISPFSSTSEGTTSIPLVLRGARLLVTRGNPHSLHLRYDCPVICTIQRHPPEVEQIHDTPIMTAKEVSCNQELLIESEFDLNDRKEFKMRSRDFYYGPIKVYLDIIVFLSSSIPALVLFLLVLFSATYDTPKWDIPFLARGPVFLPVVLVSVGIFCAINILLVRWMRFRAYTAWKATFEEGWRPRDSFVRRFVKAFRLSRGRKRKGQEKEHTGV